VPVVATRDAAPGDFAAICALNLAEVQYTSPMDAARLGVLDQMADYHKVGTVDGRVVAFLLAIRNGAPYANDNFEWFARRNASFLYVDRIVVSADARSLRLGSLLYEDLFRFARINAIPLVTCEYNIFPPNEPSRRFHDKFGFREQWTQWVQDGTKRVSLQAAET
jgi:predicted GNAT superfamily acetyltransferase